LAGSLEKEEVYFTPIGGEFGKRRSIFYSNWRGICFKRFEKEIYFYSNLREICKKKRRYILLQLAWNL